MRTFAIKLLLASVPVIGMVAVNAFYDSSHVLRDGPEREIAQLMSDGRAVGKVINYDERKVVLYYLSLQRTRRDIVVLGSSRAMQLRQRDFPNASMFNASVSANAVEDYVAIAGEHARRGLLPRRMILELDPQLLDPNHHRDGWRIMTQSYDYVMAAAGLPPAPPAPWDWERMLLVFSPSYFQQTLREQKARGDLRRPTPEAAPLDANGVVLPDGSRAYPASQERPPTQVEGLAISQASRMRAEYGAAPFTTLDPFDERRIEALIEFLQQRGTRVDAFLSPYHPTAAALLRESPVFPIFEEAERYYRDMAARTHIGFSGSFDPAKAGCTADEFYDSEHPRESCVARIVRAISVVE